MGQYNNQSLIPFGLKVTAQEPIDDKLNFVDLADVRNSAPLSGGAAAWYDGLKIYVKSENSEFVWLSENEANANANVDVSTAVLNTPYSYPAFVPAPYGGQNYNFYSIKTKVAKDYFRGFVTPGTDNLASFAPIGERDYWIAVADGNLGTGSDSLTVTNGQNITATEDMAAAGDVVSTKFAAASGVNEFTGLDDTPANYSGQSGKVLAVNSTETKLEFISTGGITSGAIGSTISQNAHGFTVLQNVYKNATGQWVLARANAENTLKQATVTEVIDANNFKVTYVGLASLTHGLSIGTTYHLSDVTAGANTIAALNTNSFYQPTIEVIDINTVKILDRQYKSVKDAGSASNAGEKIAQSAHGLSLYQNVYKNNLGVWVKAKADNLATRKQGMVSKVINANEFEITYYGVITANNHGFIQGQIYKLSDTVDGGNTINPSPTAAFLQNTFEVIDSNKIKVLDQLIELPSTSGGNADTSKNVSIAENVTQSNHGFANGDGVYYNGVSWAAALANNENTLKQGNVINATTNTFDVVSYGSYIIPNHGFTLNKTYYLSSTNPGKPVLAPPSNQGDLVQAMFDVIDANTIKFVDQAIANADSSGGTAPVNSFIKLVDTPTAYTGQANKFAKVNSTETGLEFSSLNSVLNNTPVIGKLKDYANIDWSSAAEGDAAFVCLSDFVEPIYALYGDYITTKDAIIKNLATQSFIIKHNEAGIDAVFIDADTGTSFSFKGDSSKNLEYTRPGDPTVTYIATVKYSRPSSTTPGVYRTGTILMKSGNHQKLTCSADQSGAGGSFKFRYWAESLDGGNTWVAPSSTFNFRVGHGIGRGTKSIVTQNGGLYEYTDDFGITYNTIPNSVESNNWLFTPNYALELNSSNQPIRMFDLAIGISSIKTLIGSVVEILLPTNMNNYASDSYFVSKSGFEVNIDWTSGIVSLVTSNPVYPIAQKSQYKYITTSGWLLNSAKTVLVKDTVSPGINVSSVRNVGNTVKYAEIHGDFVLKTGIANIP